MRVPRGTAMAVGLALFAGVATVWAQDGAAPHPETVMREGLASTRTNTQRTAQVAIFAKRENAWMGKLRVASGASLPTHSDPTAEYLFVLEGQGELSAGQKTLSLEPGSSVRLPPGAEVAFDSGSRTFAAIQFFAGPESGNKYSKWDVGASDLGQSDQTHRGAGAARADLEDETIRQSPDGTTEVAGLASGEEGWMGILWMEPGTSTDEHRHESEEYLYVLSGEGTLTIEGTAYDLEPDTAVLVPSGSKTTFENGDSVLTAVQFFAGPESAAKYRDWSTVSSPSIRPSPSSGMDEVEGIELKQ